MKRGRETDTYIHKLTSRLYERIGQGPYRPRADSLKSKKINCKPRMHLVWSATFIGELTSFLPRLLVLLALALVSGLTWYHPGSKRYCTNGMLTMLPMSFASYMCYFIDDKSPYRTSSVNKSDKQFPGNRTT